MEFFCSFFFDQHHLNGIKNKSHSKILFEIDGIKWNIYNIHDQKDL